MSQFNYGTTAVETDNIKDVEGNYRLGFV